MRRSVDVDTWCTMVTAHLARLSVSFRHHYTEPPTFPCASDGLALHPAAVAVRTLWGGVGHSTLWKGRMYGRSVGPAPEVMALYALHQRVVPIGQQLVLTPERSGTNVWGQRTAPDVYCFGRQRRPLPGAFSSLTTVPHLKRLLAIVESTEPVLKEGVVLAKLDARRTEVEGLCASAGQEFTNDASWVQLHEAALSRAPSWKEAHSALAEKIANFAGDLSALDNLAQRVKAEHETTALLRDLPDAPRF